MVSQIDAKNHAFREEATVNQLTIVFKCPPNEAIIDENRIEEALRAATAVPDLDVKSVDYRTKLIG